MKDKRGISGILVTVIMVVLVLGAVAVVWGIVGSLIETQTDAASVSGKCIGIDLKLTKLSCVGGANDVCGVTVTRGAKGESIDGYKLILTNDVGESNFVGDVPGNLPPLGVKTTNVTATGIADVTKVEIKAYFKDVEGNEQLC
jgi:hypothetical protein